MTTWRMFDTLIAASEGLPPISFLTILKKPIIREWGLVFAGDAPGFHLSTKRMVHSIFMMAPRLASENTCFSTREEWPKGEDILLPVECGSDTEDSRIAGLNSVNDLKDPAPALISGLISKINIEGGEEK